MLRCKSTYARWQGPTAPTRLRDDTALQSCGMLFMLEAIRVCDAAADGQLTAASTRSPAHQRARSNATRRAP